MKTEEETKLTLDSLEVRIERLKDIIHKHKRGDFRHISYMVDPLPPLEKELAACEHYKTALEWLLNSDDLQTNQLGLYIARWDDGSSAEIK